MSSIRARDPAALAAPLGSLLSRERLIVAVALASAAVLAWAWLFDLPRGSGSMGEMRIAPEPLSAGYLAPAFTMWAVMMVAMMLPSAAPMILLHARIDKSPSPRVRALHSLLFAAAYLIVWTLFAAVAAAGQAVLVGSGAVSAATLSLGSRTLAAGLLLVAGTYELTAAKRLCLEKCQAPLMFLLNHFRPGAAGAFRLGLIHGLYCLGCCWALMLLLFVGGVMNLAWVAVLGILVLGQKAVPLSWRADRLVAAVLFTGAAALALA